MRERLPRRPDSEKYPNEMSLPELALAVRALAEVLPTQQSALAEEAATQIDKLQNLNKLFGLLAPGGTAPRTALEQLWIQSETDADESAILLELRAMLAEHWGDWKPAIREAEGLQPTE